jgi:hypothetical protein
MRLRQEIINSCTARGAEHDDLPRTRLIKGLTIETNRHALNKTNLTRTSQLRRSHGTVPDLTLGEEISDLIQDISRDAITLSAALKTNIQTSEDLINRLSRTVYTTSKPRVPNGVTTVLNIVLYDDIRIIQTQWSIAKNHRERITVFTILWDGSELRITLSTRLKDL